MLHYFDKSFYFLTNYQGYPRKILKCICTRFVHHFCFTTETNIHWLIFCLDNTITFYCHKCTASKTIHYYNIDIYMILYYLSLECSTRTSTKNWKKCNIKQFFRPDPFSSFKYSESNKVENLLICSSYKYMPSLLMKIIWSSVSGP